jgi:glycosyltransferase involved in cell wall biosynthesis
MLRSADWVTGCSQHVVDRAVCELPEIAGRAERIYNGCHDPGGNEVPLPIDPVLLCVGRLVESKGFDEVLRAMPAILEEQPRTRLTVVGEGPQRPELEALCARMNLRSQTHFAGSLPRERVLAHIQAATLLVVPSQGGSEGLPIVALEAALMERPVIATRDGGLPEAVVDGRTGFLVESGDRSGLEQAILSLLRDPPLAARMGQAGRRHALEHFDWNTQVERYMRLYDRTIGA